MCDSVCVCVCVCVCAAEVSDLVCTCGMTEGPRIGELLRHDSKLFILQGRYSSLDEIPAPPRRLLLFRQHKGLFYKD